MMPVITMLPIEGIREIKAGDDLASILIAAWSQCGNIADGDILCVAHKVVSKAENATRVLKEVIPGETAQQYGARTGKDPRLVQVILDETREVLYVGGNYILCLDKRGLACANAGVDASNASEGRVILLPTDPDRSAQSISERIREKTGKKVGVVICDTHGRPFRNGASGIAIGVYGLIAQKSYIGKIDRVGRVMQSSVEAFSDELASAATLVMGQADEGIPAVAIRGIGCSGTGAGRDNIRSRESDICLQLLHERFDKND